MLKKSITYTDFNGVERTEDFLFNLSQAEIMEMEMGTTGGLAEMINIIIAKQDTPLIMKTFKDMILKSYGEKSPDGKQFVKNEEIVNNFLFSDAYNVLFMELATDADAASAFMHAVIPATEEKPSNVVPMGVK